MTAFQGTAGNDEVLYQGGDGSVALGDGNDVYRILKLSGNADHSIVDGGNGVDTFVVEYDSINLGVNIDLLSGKAQVGATTWDISGFEVARVGAEYQFSPGDWHSTLAGTAQSDDLISFATGTSILLGRGGNDRLNYLIGFSPMQGPILAYGGPGNDKIQGGDGADWLNGDGHYSGDPAPLENTEGGSDYITGGNGNDHIFGASQNAVQGSSDATDWIYADDGMDYVNGNGGSDQIFGGAGLDRLYGGAGDDMICGDEETILISTPGAGNDHINGNKGDDWLFGGGGNDQILGGQGSDVLIGGFGIDTLSGNAGPDVFMTLGDQFNGGPAGPFIPDIITDFEKFSDRIATRHNVTAVLHGVAADYVDAFKLANALLPAVAPDPEPAALVDEPVAAIQVGSDTLVFYNDYGAGPTAAFQLLNTAAGTIDVLDFV